MTKLKICSVQVVESLSDKFNVLSINEDTTSENITLCIAPTVPKAKDLSQYKNHYVTIAIVCPMSIPKVNTADNRIYFVHNNILCTNKYTLPCYKIEFSPGFKFKKFIRDKLVNQFNFKNKDIQVIKNINTVENYHNYIVHLVPNKRTSQFPVQSSLVTHDSTHWCEILGMYDSYLDNPSNSQIYFSLYKNDKSGINFENGNNKDIIKLSEIYNLMSIVV